MASERRDACTEQAVHPDRLRRGQSECRALADWLAAGSVRHLGSEPDHVGLGVLNG